MSRGPWRFNDQQFKAMIKAAIDAGANVFRAEIEPGKITLTMSKSGAGIENELDRELQQFEVRRGAN